MRFLRWKPKKGERVKIDASGPHYQKKATIEFVRKDGGIVIDLEDGTGILVVYPSDISLA